MNRWERRLSELVDGQRYEKAVADAMDCMSSLASSPQDQIALNHLKVCIDDIKRFGTYDVRDAGDTGGFMCPEARQQIGIINDFVDALTVTSKAPDLWVLNGETNAERRENARWFGFFIGVLVGTVLGSFIVVASQLVK